MGLGGISIWQLLIVLAIIILIFGTKKFKNIGSDLGGAVKGFKKAMNDESQDKQEEVDPKQIKQNDADFAEAETEVKAKDTQKTEK